MNESLLPMDDHQHVVTVIDAIEDDCRFISLNGEILASCDMDSLCVDTTEEFVLLASALRRKLKTESTKAVTFSVILKGSSILLYRGSFFQRLYVATLCGIST